MNPPPTLLVIDDDAIIRRAVHRTLTSQGYRVLTAGDGDEGLDILANFEVDVALIDFDLRGQNGIDVLRQARKQSPTTECVIFTGQGDVSVAYNSLDAGATEFFRKPIRDWQRFNEVLRRAYQARQHRKDRTLLPKEPETKQQTLLIGNSPSMVKVRSLIRSIAVSAAPVLILGESGVGKDLVARTLHESSGRNGQFVAINCAFFPHDLIEGELFGWERGAHSMASQAKRGLFEVAGGGTILLDEIGDMPIDLQAKLLRVLESKRYRRLGSTQELTLDTRVVAATNQDLDKAITDGRFRQDLLYRINVVAVDVPPLRDRREDIPHLSYHFVTRFSEQEGHRITQVSPEVLRRLEQYDWPGNVRELRNVLHRAVLLCKGSVVDESVLPHIVKATQGGGSVVESVPEQGSQEPRRGALDQLLEQDYAAAKQQVLHEFTVQYLASMLDRHGGNITRAADAAGMLRPNFKRLMKRHGVEVPKGERGVGAHDKG